MKDNATKPVVGTIVHFEPEWGFTCRAAVVTYV